MFRQRLKKVRVVTRDKTDDFDSLKEALEIFPTLNMYRGCVNFTCALDDHDALLFEAWDVHNALNED